MDSCGINNLNLNNKNMEYDIKKAKKTAEELYKSTPIGVLRYITCLEEENKQLSIPRVVGSCRNHQPICFSGVCPNCPPNFLLSED